MRYWKFWWVAVLSIALDRVVKIWAETALPAMAGGTMPIIPNVFHLTYVENRGMAFGLMQGARWPFVVVTGLVVIALLLYVTRKRDMPTLQRFTMWLILGGALGNWFDRAWRGYVVDLFDARFINFAVFNVADICVVVGVILLAIVLIFFPEGGERHVRASGSADGR